MEAACSNLSCSNAVKALNLRQEGEEGFVLVSAIWLLLLGAAVVAIIQFTVLNRAKSLTFEKDQIEHRLALETAYETAIADMLFNGPRSAFAKMPSQMVYTLNGVSMTISVSSESGKLDINQADPALIDRALMGLGIDASKRTAFLGVLAGYRSSGFVISMTADLEAALQQAGVGPAGGFCGLQYLTAHSGLPRPFTGQMPPELARAIGEPSTQRNSGFQPGSALRIAITKPGGPSLVAVVRMTGRLDQAVDVLDWRIGGDCAT